MSAPLPPPYQYIILHQSCRNHVGVLAVQSAHAAGESCFDGPPPAETRVVALEALKSEDLDACALKLQEAGIPHVLISEPDEPYFGAAVALGIAPTRDRDTVKPYVAHFKILR